MLSKRTKRYMFTRHMFTRPLWPGLGLLLWALSLDAQVVFNEIFYHGSDNLNDLQWIEFYNTTDKPLSLAGWKITHGIKFSFASDAAIPGHGYLVICRDRERFQEFYDAPVAGEFDKNLKRGGERLDLRNAANELVDSLAFDAQAPWPTSPDGRSASLERICPSAASNLPENWAASPLTADDSKPGGTPGKPNAAYSASLPPIVSHVSFNPTNAQPGQAITVEAAVQDPAGLREVKLFYRIVRPGSESEEKSLPMSVGANSRYSAVIPGQANGQIVRFRLRAVNQKSAARFFPGENEPQPALSCLVQTIPPPAKIPFAYIIHTSKDQVQNDLERNPGDRRGRPFDNQGMMRQMAQRQFRSSIDLPGLWTSLSLGSATAEEALKLRPFFKQKSTERDQLEKKTLTTTNYVETARAIPTLVKSFKTGLGDALKPLLTPEQTKIFESWRGPSPGGGTFGRDTRSLLQQVLPLEPAYFYLATRDEITEAQLTSLREIYREAIQQRDSMSSEARVFMSGDGDREGVMAKFDALQTGVNAKLRAVLNSSQMGRLTAWRERDQPNVMGRGGAKPARPARGKEAFVYVDAQTRVPRLFDFVSFTDRHGGYKVHFDKDHTLDGMPVINLAFKESDRWSLTEPLSYELHRRAGEDVGRIDYVRLYVDGMAVGYHLMFEQPDKAFLRRIGLRDDGNLYKGTYMGSGVIGQNTKKSKPQAGHDDLVQLVEQLEKTKSDPAAQWALIQREFEVEKLVSHYAVRMLLSDWDGFFNNYYLYHDVKGTQKWTLYVWDQDKTWGDYDGYDNGGVLFNLPLTFGAEGDKPPGWKRERPPTGFMQPGMPMWWRAGGWISKPVLANPIFRRHFLARIKDLLEKEFTEERILPLIDQLRDRLQAEVRFRAEAAMENPAGAQKRFEHDLASLKEFLTKRRAWLLKQEDVRTAAPYDRAQLK